MVRFKSDIFIMPSIKIKHGSGLVLVWLINLFTVQSYLQWRGHTLTCLEEVQILPYLCRQDFPLSRSCQTVPMQNMEVEAIVRVLYFTFISTLGTISTTDNNQPGKSVRIWPVLLFENMLETQNLCVLLFNYP